MPVDNIKSLLVRGKERRAKERKQYAKWYET